MALTDPTPRLGTSDLMPRSRWHGARMTLDEFLALPEEKPYLEWDNGVALQKDMPRERRETSDFVPPEADHGSLQTEIAVQLDRVSRESRLGKVFTETRIITPALASSSLPPSGAKVETSAVTSIGPAPLRI